MIAWKAEPVPTSWTVAVCTTSASAGPIPTRSGSAKARRNRAGDLENNGPRRERPHRGPLPLLENHQLVFDVDDVGGFAGGAFDGGAFFSGIDLAAEADATLGGADGDLPGRCRERLV